MARLSAMKCNLVTGLHFVTDGDVDFIREVDMSIPRSR